MFIWNQTEKLAICPALSAGHKKPQSYQSETGGNRGVPGFFHGIPQLPLLVGADNKVSSTGPCLGRCISESPWLHLMLLLIPLCLVYLLTKAHSEPFCVWRLRVFEESKPHEWISHWSVNAALSCTKIRHQRVILKIKCKCENTISAWRQCFV